MGFGAHHTLKLRAFTEQPGTRKGIITSMHLAVLKKNVTSDPCWVSKSCISPFSSYLICLVLFAKGRFGGFVLLLSFLRKHDLLPILTKSAGFKCAKSFCDVST